MKRIISFLLCVMLLASLTVPVSAAEPEIIFTDESFYHPGFTMEVDKGKTLESCYNNGTSDIYNAYLEGRVQYYWMRNDSYYADGPSITIREEDRCCSFYCMAALYADEDHIQQIGTIYSDSFFVPNDLVEPEIPEIITDDLPNAVVGQEYYFQLECTDPDVHYSLFRSSLPAGMYLTQHGEIEGTPTEAGMWYVVIMATPEAGEDYATTAEFEFYVVEDGPDYTLEIMRLPNKLTYFSGEYLDMTGAWVRIWTPEGYLDSYDGEYLGYTDQPLVSIGDHVIDLTYMDGETSFIVSVRENPNAEYHTVTYYLDGDLYEEMEVRHGEYAEDLLVPEVEGMAFTGWLTEEGEYYDFSAPVTGDLEVYGAYGYVVALCFGIDNPVGWQVVEPGRCAIEPEPPAQEGKEFLGWYTEFNGGVKFDFSTPITGNINLYARFVDATPFADVPADSFYYEPVLWALENGITTGASATTFNPDGPCLRAQVVTFLWRAEGQPALTHYNNPFTDVGPNDFFFVPVQWAVAEGITNGTSATTFGSYDNCNRAAVVTFLWRAAGCPEPKAVNNPFVDVKTTDFFYKAVLWAVENGITNGVDATHFGPAAGCNRAQVVTFLYRAYN